MMHLQVILQIAVLAGATPTEEDRSLASIELGEMVLEAPLLLSSRFESTSRYAIDADQTPFEADAVDTLVRVGARFDAKRALVPFLVLAEYEHDLFTGTNTALPGLQGDGFPTAEASTDELRKLHLRVSLGWYVHAGFGFNTSHWGLGLVANDGAHGFTPGSAAFIDPRGGDRVLRGFVATGPHTDLKLFASIAFDDVVDDDALLDGDDAQQLAAAVLIGRGLASSAGIYVVRRNQDSGAGGSIDVNVVDVTARTSGELEGLGTWSVEGELAHVFGETTVAGTPEFPAQDVSQLGIALRAGLDGGFLGGVLDLLYASGDQNLDDRGQHAFKVDPNYPLGLLLHRHLLAAGSARSVHNAADPELSGLPPRGLNRIPTRGSVSNTLALFPRIFWRPVSSLELYGGPLFAWSATPNIDPLHTRLAGGTPRNAFDRAPGNYLGTELDLGIRYRPEIYGTLLELGGEFGVLAPGSAFEGGPRRVLGGRAFVSYRL